MSISFGRLNVPAVIEEVANRDTAGELRHGAHVIAVPVRRDERVDLRDARGLDRGHDALRIAAGGRAAVARVDQHRLAGRSDEQRGVAAFDVEDVDIERCRLRRKDGRAERRQGARHISSVVSCHVPTRMNLKINAEHVTRS